MLAGHALLLGLRGPRVNRHVYRSLSFSQPEQRTRLPADAFRMREREALIGSTPTIHGGHE